MNLLLICANLRQLLIGESDFWDRQVSNLDTKIKLVNDPYNNLLQFVIYLHYFFSMHISTYIGANVPR